MIHTGLEPGTNSLVLSVEVAHVGDQITNDRHVRQRIDTNGALLICKHPKTGVLVEEHEAREQQERANSGQELDFLE